MYLVQAAAFQNLNSNPQTLIMMAGNVNLNIAFTHILSNKRQTLVAAMGVAIGIGMYIFSSSMMTGMNAYFRKEMFKVSPHLKIYKEDESSQPITSAQQSGSGLQRILINPALTTSTKALENPVGILKKIRRVSVVTNAAPQVNVDVFYNKGNSQLRGVANGIVVAEADALFSLEKTMVSGSLYALQGNLEGIIIGKGIAEKLSLGLGDNLTVSSSRGVLKVMRIAGIFSSGNKNTDEGKSYINIASAQQLSGQGTDYITDIYVNTLNADKAPAFAEILQPLTPYKVEPWQHTNADMLSGNIIRDIMGAAVTITILLVAGFGIYNILNMTISQKLNDIAILKATGFNSRDIIWIFLMESAVMGILGTLSGLLFGALTIKMMSKIYIGGAVGTFPIGFEVWVFVKGAIFGMLVTLLAGYFPALKAGKIDPISIFRK